MAPLAAIGLAFMASLCRCGVLFASVRFYFMLMESNGLLRYSYVVVITNGTRVCVPWSVVSK